MKRIGLLIREKIVEEIKERAKDTPGCFFIGFNKINSLSFNSLRNKLRDCRATIFVAKNSLLRRAFKDSSWKDLNDFIDLETGLVLVYDKDITRTCKILIDFTKENESLQIKGGFIDDKKISLDELKRLAKLPPKNVLLSTVVSSLASPLTGFLNSLNQIILKFIWVIEEIKKKKEKQN